MVIYIVEVLEKRYVDGSVERFKVVFFDDLGRFRGTRGAFEDRQQVNQFVEGACHMTRLLEGQSARVEECAPHEMPAKIDQGLKLRATG